MGKVTEETWEFATDAQTGCGAELHTGPELAHCSPMPDDDTAKLAACAPEMARLLLKLADLESGSYCSWCGCSLEHLDGCPLEALLRKAGVR